MTAEPEQIEPAVGRRADHLFAVVGRGVGQARTDRTLVGALDEEAFAVDGQHPILHRHVPKAGRDRAGVADFFARPIAEDDVDLDVDELRRPEHPRPPECGLVDPDPPLDPVLARSQRVLLLGGDDPVDRGSHGGVRRSGRVEDGSEGQHRSFGGRLAAQDAEAQHAHGSGLLDPHVPPYTAGVPRRVDVGAVFEHARQVAFCRQVARPRAGDLGGEDVVGSVSQGVGDLEGVGKEVALGVTEIVAVEPQVGLVEHTVECQPPPLARGQTRGGESTPGEERPVAVGEGRLGPPMSGNAEIGPIAVVEVGVGIATAEAFVGDGGPPLSREIHEARQAIGPWAGSSSRLSWGFSPSPPSTTP